MRKILYAEGIELPEDEEALTQTEEQDERFLNRVIENLSWALSEYQERQEEFDRQEKWYFRDHYEMPVPVSANQNINYPMDGSSNFEEEHLATINIPFSAVQKAHTLMTGENPIIEVLKDTQKGKQVARMLHGVLQINTRRWGSNPIYDAIFNQLLYGWGVVRTTWSRNDWEEDSDFGGDRPLYEFPINVKSIHPKEVYPIPGGVHERWKAVVHLTRQRVYEVEEQWGVVLHMCDEDNIDGDDEFDYTQQLDPSKEVDVIDYWCWHENKIYHCVVAHNQFVMKPVHMKYYDALPFTFFFCGATTSHNAANIGLSINYALVDSVAEIEWLVNRMERIVDLYADPTLVITRINDDPIAVSPGSKQIDLIEGETARYLSHQGSLPEMDRLLSFFRTQVEEEGFATVQGQSGIDTIAQQQATMIKIFKPVENAQTAWEDINHKIVGLMQRYSWNKPIEVSGRMAGEDAHEAFSFSLKGSDTKGCRETKVMIRARFPLDELRNMTHAAAAKNSELIPDEIIRRRFLGAQDPEMWENKIYKQRVKNSPEALSFIIQNQLQLIQSQSSIQAMVEEELAKVQEQVPNQVQERAMPGMAGGREAPLEMSPQQAVSPESLNMQMMNDAASGLADSPIPPSNPQQMPMGNSDVIRRILGGVGRGQR